MRLISHHDLNGFGNIGEGAPSNGINNVYLDENGIMYVVDRIKGGIYILELTI